MSFVRSALTFLRPHFSLVSRPAAVAWRRSGENLARHSREKFVAASVRPRDAMRARQEKLLRRHSSQLSRVFERTVAYVDEAIREFCMQRLGALRNSSDSHICKHGSAGYWWAALSEDHWPASPEALNTIRRNWQEPFGDRRQEIVFIGTDAMDRAAITAQLDACLLPDDELARGLRRWSGYGDPFPKWE